MYSITELIIWYTYSMKKVSNEMILEEIKSLREDTDGRFKDIDKRFEQVNIKLDDVIIHALDTKRILTSHTEMIGSLSIDLEEIKLMKSKV